MISAISTKNYLKNYTVNFIRFSILLTILITLTSNITNSFFIKWGFRELDPVASLTKMIDGTANKPFVFRSAVPKLVNFTISQIDEKYINKFYLQISKHDSLKKHYFSNISNDIYTPKMCAIYYSMFALVFISYFFSLFYLRLIFLHFSNGFSASILSIIIFSLCYPLLFELGGYYYDFFELFFATLSVYLWIKQKKILGSISMILAVFNKETAFLLGLSSFFLHSKNTAKITRWIYLSTILCFSLLIRHLIMSGYDDNPGSTFYFAVLGNFLAFINPLSYFHFEQLYGVIASPTIENVLLIFIFIFWFKKGWVNVPKNMRYPIMASILPTAVLWAICGNFNELRVFSIVLPYFFIIFIHGFQPLLKFIDQK